MSWPPIIRGAKARSLARVLRSFDPVSESDKDDSVVSSGDKVRLEMLLVREDADPDAGDCDGGYIHVAP